MYVRFSQSYSPPRYLLCKYTQQGGERQREVLCNFGPSKPKFSNPDLRLAFCEDQLKNVDDKSVDLLIDDPPYGNTVADWDEEPDWAELAEQYHRVLADDGQVVVFGRQPSLIPVFNEFTDKGFEFRFELIWKKQNNPWVSDQQPIPIHENIFVFKKSATKVGELTFKTEEIKRDGIRVCPRCEDEEHLGGYSYSVTNDRKSETQGGWQEVYEQISGEERHPISFLDRDVLEFTSVVGSSDEYTGYAGQKPVALLRWLVIAMSERGDTVLDPHMGSASTAMACIPICRESIGFEADPQRFKTAEERVEEMLDDLRGLKHADVQPVDRQKQTPNTVAGADD
jgi:site-specific DNA-methyltransferase (adenine-specific)